MQYKSLVDVLIARSADTHGITFIESSSIEVRLSYKDLYDRSLVVLYNFQRKGLLPGDEVVVQLDNNKDFIDVFRRTLQLKSKSKILLPFFVVLIKIID